MTMNFKIVVSHMAIIIWSLATIKQKTIVFVILSSRGNYFVFVVAIVLFG